jgi:hypothetical protein
VAWQKRQKIEKLLNEKTRATLGEGYGNGEKNSAALSRWSLIYVFRSSFSTVEVLTVLCLETAIQKTLG